MLDVADVDTSVGENSESETEYMERRRAVLSCRRRDGVFIAKERVWLAKSSDSEAEPDSAVGESRLKGLSLREEALDCEVNKNRRVGSVAERGGVDDMSMEGIGKSNSGMVGSDRDCGRRLQSKGGRVRVGSS